MATLSDHRSPDGPLGNLFGAYLHQDFDLEFRDVWAAIEDCTSTNPPQWVAAAHRELVEILDDEFDEPSLEALLERYGCYYYPPGTGYTYGEWLREVEVRLRHKD